MFRYCPKILFFSFIINRLLRLLFGFFLLLLCSSNIYAQVFINEVGSFESSGDWVELYSNEDIDISGWILRDSATSKIETISEGSIIGPSSSEYFIIDAANRLNVDEDIVKLFKSDDITLVDQMAYGGEGDVCSPQLRESIGRLPDGSVSVVRFSVQTKGDVNIDQQSLCPTVTPFSTENPTSISASVPTSTSTPTPIIISTATPSPTITKSPTPRPTVTKTPVPIETEENNTEEEVLGIQYELPTSSPFAENNVEIEPKKPKLLAILFIIIGIFFIGFAGFAFIKQKGLNNNESDKNQKII